MRARQQALGWTVRFASGASTPASVQALLGAAREDYAMELGPSCEQKHSAVLQIVQEETVLLLQHKHTLPAISLAEWKFRHIKLLQT